jgi:hypothetical protein
VHHNATSAHGKRYDRDAIIAANPILSYCEARGWALRRDGSNWKLLCPFPLHREKTPSFTIFPDNHFHCFGCGAHGTTIIDLVMGLRGCSAVEAMAELSGNPIGSAPMPPRKKYDPEANNKKRAAARRRWPVLKTPTAAEISAIAELRELSPEGVTLAAEVGLLFCAESREGRAWVVSDFRRINAQARRLDGKRWAHIGNAKSWTLPGSFASWPIGLREAQAFEKIALVEGGPDLLAAFHLIWIASQEENIAPVAMLGSSNDIPPQALPLFAGKRVRIFAHRDENEVGICAENRWWEQLDKAGTVVDGYSFKGLITSDGEPVNDVCDFAHVDVDTWEREREDLEEAFML